MSELKPWNAEIISVGDELIRGAYVDLNAPRLARALNAIGVEPQRFSTVPDQQPKLAEALKIAASRSSVVLVTGGLGPTEDDITRHAAAEAAGVPLDFDENSWQQILHFMQKRGRNVSESNKLSAMFPRGATIIPNGAGTAPGFRMQLGHARLYFLPGPPHEADQMLDLHVLPDLSKQIYQKSANVERRLHLFGISESSLGEKIADRMKRGRNPSVGTTVRKGVITVNIFAQAPNREQAQQSADSEAQAIRDLFADFIFGEDGLTLPESLIQTFKAQKLTIATAESCTGGLVGKLLTDVPGSSEAYRGGFIVYSNELKQKLLGVSAKTLEKHGAVSEETAREMVENAAKITQADIAVAVTGIAGPGGGSAEKPVGLVYEAVSYRGKTVVEKKIYPPGDRKRIRDLAARDVLNLARMTVLKG